jgi:peptidoglycan/LPS O-acetylase OafA/YrhL
MNINYDKRVYGLDIFRAIAILIVVASHGRLVAGSLFNDLPTIFYLDGVELFFVLSGFLIGSILIKIIEKEDKFSLAVIMTFWKRRWFRTLPNYYLILLINILLIYCGITSGNIEGYSYSFLFFLQNFSKGDLPFYWESWSLTIEEWFYLTLPLCILVLRQFLSKQKTILWSIILLLTIPFIYRVSISHITTNSFYMWDVLFRKTVLTRLDAIIYGVLAAYIKFYHSVFWTKHRNAMFIAGIAVTILRINLVFPFDHFFSKTIAFNLTSIGAMLLLPKADSIKSFKYQVIGKSITYISIISYSLYLVNLGLVEQVITYNFPPQNPREQVCLYIIFWVATFVISALIYKFYEKPMMDLRDKFGKNTGSQSFIEKDKN